MGTYEQGILRCPEQFRGTNERSQNTVSRTASHKSTIIAIVNQINELYEQYGDIGLPLMEISPSVGQVAVIGSTVKSRAGVLNSSNLGEPIYESIGYMGYRLGAIMLVEF